MKHFIYTFIVLIIAISCAAQEQRNLLLDFNKIIDSTNYLIFYTKNEVVAEAITAEGRKSITIFNLYLPKNTNFNALNKRTTDQLCTFFVLPTNKKQDVSWLEIPSTDSIVVSALKYETFVNSCNFTTTTPNNSVYKILTIIVKKGDKYYKNEGRVLTKLADFEHRQTYYPTESTTFNCYARLFSEKNIREENRQIKAHYKSKGCYYEDERRFSQHYYINKVDSFSVHFEQYYQLNDSNFDMFHDFCANSYPNKPHYWHFTEFDVHPVFGVLGGFFFCDTDDLLKSEADKLASRYYHFKTIDGYTDIKEYRASFLKNK